MISIRLQATGQLSHCDLIFIPRHTQPGNKIPEAKAAYIALAGASLPNRIAVHYLTFDFTGPAPNQRPFLHAKLDCLISLPSKKLPQYSVVNVKFDRSLPIHNFNHRPLFIVRSNGKKCYVSKWVPKIDPQSQTSPFYSLIKEIKPKSISSSPFISVVQCFTNGDILLCYFDGNIELRDGKTLDIKTNTRNQSLSNKIQKTDHIISIDDDDDDDIQMKDEKEEKEKEKNQNNKIVGKPFPSPLSIAVSPNNTAFCLLDYHCTLHIYVREQPFEGDPKYVFKKISDLFELCILLGISCWDILLYCCDYCKYYSDANSVRNIIGYMISDFKKFSQDAQEIYYSAFQSIYSRLLHLSEIQITNQMDCQARLFVDYIHDTFFAHFSQVKVSVGGNFFILYLIL